MCALQPHNSGLTVTVLVWLVAQLLQAQGPDNPDLLRHIAGGSNNVDESGNFSIMVLSEALKRAHGLTLSQANMDTVISNATAQRGYILHLQDHWFAIRRIGGEFWNLDSMKKRPSFVGDIYLGAFLSQMRSEGYSIFVVQGELPEPLQGASMGDPQNWHSVTKLKAHESDTSMLGGGSSDAIPAETLASWAATARQDPSMFEIILASLMESTGKARADAEMMLVMAMSQGGDEADQTSSTSGTHPAAHDSRGGPESTEDEDSDLAAAIALSMQQG